MPKLNKDANTESIIQFNNKIDTELYNNLFDIENIHLKNNLDIPKLE